MYEKELGALPIATAATQQFDILLAGGGLASSLIALHMKRVRPELRVGVVDATPEPAPHTWCLFESDLEEGWQALPITPDHVWGGYGVEFPEHNRALATEYGCLTSASLRGTLRETLGEDLVVGTAKVVTPQGVTCEDGRLLSGKVTIDGRGARPSSHLQLGWQKFVGLELQLRRPHGLERPIVMDATVRQLDGFRFIYVLPLAPDRVLVEDTRYSDGAVVDRNAFKAEILRYARGQGWLIADVLGEEEGVLPVVLGGDIQAFWREADRQTPQVGMRGAFFHPTTGYSFPDAIRTARVIEQHLDRGSERLAEALKEASIRSWRERSFYRLLNRMLYKAAEPEHRYGVLQRFYRLPEPLIERFYAGRTTFADKARVLSGKPPVPIWRALRAAAESRPAHANA